MILDCNKKCYKSGGRTEGSLDLDTNKIICTKCDEEIVGISDFMKEAMKRSGDIIKKSTSKAFTFKCVACNKMVETDIVNGVPIGKNCETKACSINISQIMANAIEKMKPIQVEEE